MFDLVFNGMMTFQQAGMLIAALVLCILGGLLLWNEIYVRINSRRVNGTVVGVRQKGKCYHVVYRYMLPTGETFESTNDSGDSFTGGKETHRTMPLLVSPKDPLKIRAANSYAGCVIGCVLLAPGVVLAYVALTSYPMTPLTGAMLAGFAFYGAMKFRKYIIPKEQRLAPADWKATRKAARKKEMESLPVRQIEDILASPEAAAEKALQKKNSRFAAPFVLLFALGLMYGGYDQYSHMSQLEKGGVGVEGKITGIESRNDSDGGYMHYPVVRFTDQEGKAVTFTGRNGTNPSMYRADEKVKVLYLAASPEKSARIDHGFWNRVVPMIIFGGGALLLLLFFRLLA